MLPNLFWSQSSDDEHLNEPGPTIKGSQVGCSILWKAVHCTQLVMKRYLEAIRPLRDRGRRSVGSLLKTPSGIDDNANDWYHKEAPEHPNLHLCSKIMQPICTHYNSRKFN